MEMSKMSPNDKDQKPLKINAPDKDGKSLVTSGHKTPIKVSDKVVT